MLGSTHRIGGMAIGAAVPVFLQSYTGQTFEDPLVFVFLTMSGGGLGSLIPDIDSTTSTIGRRVKGLSKFIAEKFGHRGGTHTILACVLFSIICSFITENLEKYLSVNVNNEKILLFASVNAVIVVSSCLFILGAIPNKYRGPLSKKNDKYIILLLTIATVFFTFKNTILVVSYIEIYMIGVVLGYISHIILDLFTKEGVPLLRPLLRVRFKLLPFKTGSFVETIFSLLGIYIIISSLLELLN